MGSVSDFPGFVKGFDAEGDDLPIDLGDFRLGSNLQPHRGGGDMLNVQHSAYGGLAFSQSIFNGVAGGALHQRHHTGGGVNQQVAGANLLSGILPFGGGFCFALHAYSNLHWNHNLSFFLYHTRNPRDCQ